MLCICHEICRHKIISEKCKATVNNYDDNCKALSRYTCDKKSFVYNNEVLQQVK